MDTKRQSKINRLIQKEVGQILQKQTKAAGNIIISVSDVSVTSDLSTARIYLSIFPNEKSEEIIKNIRGNSKTFRYDVAKILRYQLRKIPEFEFFIDESQEYAKNIDTILNKIKK